MKGDEPRVASLHQIDDQWADEAGESAEHVCQHGNRALVVGRTERNIGGRVVWNHGGVHVRSFVPLFGPSVGTVASNLVHWQDRAVIERKRHGRKLLIASIGV